MTFVDSAVRSAPKLGRCMCIILLFCGGLFNFAALLAAGENDPVLLQPAPHSAIYVDHKVSVTGELKLLVTTESTPEQAKDRAQQKVTKLPVEVQAQLAYTAKSLATGEGSDTLQHEIRCYKRGQADMRVGKGSKINELSADHRAIVMIDSTRSSTCFCPAEPLSRDEFDLLQAQGDAGLLNTLLPTKESRPGDSWTPTTNALARLFRWDEVQTSNVTCKFNRVQDGVAIIDVTGKASGAVESATTDLEIAGKLNFHLAKKTCTWFAATLKENRAATPSSPGFETTAQVRVAAAPCGEPEELSSEVVAKLKTEADGATSLLRLQSTTAGLEFVYEPQWRVVSERPDLVVVRNVSQGDLVAQANISRLPVLAKGEQLTLEGFQRDLKQTLGSSFVEFIEASEGRNESGLRTLRVVASGRVSDVPLHWIFYHLSDDAQHRVSIAFNMDAENAERFGRDDETLIASFRFLPDATPSEQGTAQAQKSTPAVRK